MPCGATKDNGHQEKNGQDGHCAFEDLDHSILQQPLNLGVNNIKQILQCVQGGTREVKDLLMNECHIIYECKVCSNLFRSLANFMYHKRCYCKKHLCEDMLLFDNIEEETIVVQPEKSDERKKKFSAVLDAHPEIQECHVSVVRADIPPGYTMIVQDNSKIESVRESEIELKSTVNSVKINDVDDEIIKVDDDDSPSRKGCSENLEKNLENVSNTKQENEITTPKVNPMVSRRTRDKNKRETFSAVVNKSTVEKDISPVEPVLLKLIPKGSSKGPSYTAQLKKQNFSFVAKNQERVNKIKSLSGSKTPFPAITLKAIDNNPHAVYQSCEKKGLIGKVNNKSSSCNGDVPEKDKIIIVVAKKDMKNATDASAVKASVESKQSKGKASKQHQFHMTRRKRLMTRSDCNVHELKCLVCNTQFMSLKTLFFHMMSLHSKKRQYYPCPFCKTSFVQTYGVTRHLMSIHKKTKEQIAKLRETIKRKAVWRRVDDMNHTGEKLDTSHKDSAEEPNMENTADMEPSDNEKQQPNTTDTEMDDKNKTDISSLNTCIKFNKKLTLHKCSKCQRVFGRKSSQVSHEKFCIMNAIKLEISDKGQPIPQKSPPIISIIPVSPVKQPIFSDIKISMRPKRGAEKQMHKDFVNSQTLKWRSANKVDTNNQVIPISKKITGKNVEKRVMNIIDTKSLTCLKCDKKFSSFSNLRRHAAIHVGWTRFQCKYCDYQAYNKSQCWGHVQKLHSIADSEVDKCIVSLVCGSASLSSQKTVKQSSTNIKLSKSNATTNKAKISKIKSPNESTKIVVTPKKVLNDTKKEKVLRPIEVLKYSDPDCKKEVSNYKSVTTSNPTTIILSKKVSNVTVQPILSRPSSPTVSSTSGKFSLIRTSPRKIDQKLNDDDVSSLTSLVTRSGAYKKDIVIPIRFPPKQNLPEEKKRDLISGQSPEKLLIKKDRLISEWFPRKDMMGIVRRDSAPLIIGLVPASSSVTGVSAKVKNSVVPNDRNNSYDKNVSI